MDHSPEPWNMFDGGFLNEWVCKDANGNFLYGHSSDEGSIDSGDPNWIRIVTCVNFCRGISTEILDAFNHKHQHCGILNSTLADVMHKIQSNGTEYLNNKAKYDAIAESHDNFKNGIHPSQENK